VHPETLLKELHVDFIDILSAHVSKSANIMISLAVLYAMSYTGNRHRTNGKVTFSYIPDIQVLHFCTNCSFHKIKKNITYRTKGLPSFQLVFLL
jgi:hypothetical protein